MVYRFQITYDDIMEKVDLKHISSGGTGCSQYPGKNEITDINETPEDILTNISKVTSTTADFRLKSNINFNQTLIFTGKWFFSILGFTQCHSGVLGDIERFFQIIPGRYTSDKPVNITRYDKIQLKYDCNNGSIVNAVREPIV